MRKEIDRIIIAFQESYQGPAWHGPAVLETLGDLSTPQLVNRINGSHNIAELVAHMTAWRRFLLNNQSGLAPYDVSPAENFQEISSINEEEWKELLQQLEKSQEDILALLQQVDDSLLDQIVPGRQYNFYTLLHGIIQHDLYHLGQIVSLSKYAKS